MTFRLTVEHAIRFDTVDEAAAYADQLAAKAAGVARLLRSSESVSKLENGGICAGQVRVFDHLFAELRLTRELGEASPNVPLGALKDRRDASSNL